jgi:ribosomal protein S15P/S13E
VSCDILFYQAPRLHEHIRRHNRIVASKRMRKAIVREGMAN